MREISMDPTQPLADSIAEDALHGVKAIAAEIGEDEKRTYYLCSRGYIPAGKLGAGWVASRRKLREHYDRLTQGTSAAALAPQKQLTLVPVIRRRRNHVVG